MSTSEPDRVEAGATPRHRVLDAIALAFVFSFVPEYLRAGVALEPHPAWIAVLVLAARDGGLGFFVGLVASALSAALAAAVRGAPLATLWSHFDSGPNLIACGSCLLVSWVGAWQLRRQAALGARLSLLSDRAVELRATLEAFREVVTMLRTRVDRTSSSLSFLREVAAQLEGTDPVAAAQGAADLALARTGACAAAVHVGVGGSRRLLAMRDARAPRAQAPLEVSDADVAVPVGTGTRIGSITLWGVPDPGLNQTMARDLAIIASWCAPAVSPAAWRREEVGRT